MTIKSNGEQKRLPKLCFDHSEQLLHSVDHYLEFSTFCLHFQILCPQHCLHYISLWEKFRYSRACNTEVMR